MILISSCLVGINCRYNATSSRHLNLEQMIRNGKAIAVCPELLAGLPTPRPSCEIVITENSTKKVLDKNGNDYTKAFTEAAEKTLAICKIANIHKAILQSRSPSCGCGKIYDGEFSGKLVDGYGLTADLLKNNGIEVVNEENFCSSQ